MGGSNMSTNNSSMRLVYSALGSRKTLVSIILILLCVIFYLLLSQGSRVVYDRTAGRESECCKCPSPALSLRERKGLLPRSSDCAHGTQRRFPHAIIIGVRKAGTRALINMLRSHPDILAAMGEVHFFDRQENFNKGVDWYIEQMPCTTQEQFAIEKSPSYFSTKEVPTRIATLSNNVKLLLIVRHPIDRAVSDFTQLNNKRSNEKFENVAFHPSGAVNEKYNPISLSIYADFLQHWLEHFKLEQIHLVDGDSLIKNPILELQKAERFLEVRNFFHKDMFYFNETKGFYCWKKTNRKGEELPYCLGDAKGRVHPNISVSAVTKLKEFFRPHNEHFYSLAHHNFEW